VRAQLGSRESWMLLIHAMLGRWAESVRRWYRRAIGLGS
jgi:hypothetical protein